MLLCHEVNFSKWRAIDLEPKGYHPQALSFHSAGLELLCSLARRMQNPKVFHLGPIRPALLNMLAPSHPFITVVDPSVDATLEDPPVQCFEQSYDIFILWDRLLYLKPEEVAGLSECLASHSHAGSALLTYTSTREIVAANPYKFAVREDLQIEMVPQSEKTRTRAPIDLAKSLSGWRCQRTVQLRNSYREHLLVFRGK